MGNFTLGIFPTLEIIMKLVLLSSILFLFPAAAFAGSTIANSGATAELNAPINSNFSQTFQASEQKREFPNTPGMVSPGLPTMFMDARPTVEFQPMVQFQMLKQEWTVTQVRSFTKKSDIDSVNADFRVAEKAPVTDKLKISICKPEDYVYLGQIVLKAKKKGVNTDALFCVAAQKAFSIGGNILAPVTEGGNPYLDLNAWVMSLGYVRADMGGANSGGVAGMGLGYASGTTQYHATPFLRFAILRVKAKEYMAIKPWTPPQKK